MAHLFVGVVVPVPVFLLWPADGGWFLCFVTPPLVVIGWFCGGEDMGPRALLRLLAVQAYCLRRRRLALWPISSLGRELRARRHFERPLPEYPGAPIF